MLVRFNEHLRRARDESGSTLVVVLIVMLVLSIAGLTLAAIVTSTTGMLVSNRSTAESRAAADAGLAEGVAQARRTGDFCSLSLSSASAPSYTVTSSCADSKVTFVSTGTGKSAGQTKTQAVYDYTVPSASGSAAELVFFNSPGSSVYFTSNVFPQGSPLATIQFPGGGKFECKTTLPANVAVKGAFEGQDGCKLNGSLHVGGVPPIEGKGKSPDYAILLRGADALSGTVKAGGNVLLDGTGVRINGQLTIPTAANLYVTGSIATPAQTATQVPGGVVKQSVAPPVFEPWFEYDGSSLATDWIGDDGAYAIETITPTSSARKCSDVNKWTSDFWSSFVSGLTTDTVIDLRACPDGIATGGVDDANAKIGVKVAIIANKFALGDFSLGKKPGAGDEVQAWMIVPDTVDDGQPTCGDKKDDRNISTLASVTVTVPTMAYTPCTISVGAGGTWTGSMYSGFFQHGGAITINTHSMALPHQWGSGAGGSGGSGTPTLGDLISQRDVP